MELSGALRYRFGILSDIVIYSVLLVFFLSSGTGQSYSDAYGYNNYHELLIAGYLAWFYAVSAISSGLFLAAGCAAFSFFLQKAKRTGNLLFY